MISYQTERESGDFCTATSPLLLCVDDNEQLLRLKSATLSANGYRVLSTSSPNTAYEVMKHFSVDVLITDLDMPEIDGAQLADMVRNGLAQTTPIILHTGGSTSERDDLKSIDHLVPKASPVGTLIQAVRSALTSRS